MHIMMVFATFLDAPVRGKKPFQSLRHVIDLSPKIFCHFDRQQSTMNDAKGKVVMVHVHDVEQ